MRRCGLPCICDVWLKHTTLFCHWFEKMQISDMSVREACLLPSLVSATSTCGGSRAQRAMSSIPLTVCDLGFFASRPQRRVVWLAFNSVLCAKISSLITKFDNDRFISYRPGWVLEIPGQAQSVGELFHWMKGLLVFFFSGNENWMLDLIDTFFYRLFGRGAGPSRWPLLF